eukprot:s308_g4.t2
MSDQRHLMVADEECGAYHETGRNSQKRWVYGISAALGVAAVATLVIFKMGSPTVASDVMRSQELFKDHPVKDCPAGHFHQCPSEWKAPGNAGGYHCLHKLARQTSQKAYESSGGACRPAKEGPFPYDDCQDQCGIGATVSYGSHVHVVHHVYHGSHKGNWGYSSHHGSHWGSSYYGSPHYHGSHWGSSYYGSPDYHDSHWGSSYYGSPDYQGDYVPEYTDDGTPALAGDEQYKEWKSSVDGSPVLAGDEQYKEWKSSDDGSPVLAGDEQYKEWKSSDDGSPVLAGDEEYKQWKDSLSDQVQYVPDSAWT